MKSPLSSPERGPLKCTVTYLDRKKRKRTTSNADIASKSVISSMKPPKTPHTPKESNAKAPASMGAKQVGVTLPGPSPKRPRRSSDDESTGSEVKKASHSESVSAPIRKPKSKAGNSPDSSAKCESISAPVRKPKSKAKSVAADDFDDGASVADSFISTTRIRRNEGERIEYFKNQPECGKLEPHSAECIKCRKIVNLGRKQTYAVRPWEIHRARCDLKPAQVVPDTFDSFKPSSDTGKVQQSSPEVPARIIPTPARRPTEAERKGFLEDDTQIQDLEEHRARCRKCQNWIALSETHAYATGNWVKHKNKCSDAVPSNRVAAAKRKLLLVNDKQVKSFAIRGLSAVSAMPLLNLKEKVITISPNGMNTSLNAPSTFWPISSIATHR
ncbi:hypothetical protein CPB84DRAFT_429337 [Gymnopilus junonius]|uniref:Uncharacterized protein n=1 Tax=Gymnopilus junonius TaxID=109634 RepID=A0A9P5NTP5_GYMJU|nr:hypothetical protein CPB84DRAFT_429337 [Gymnopilus junonius]